MSGVLRLNIIRAGFEVATALNGRLAWEQLQQERFDLLVSDYQMPELDGKELILRMRQDERLATIPVILLTAKALELDLKCVCDEWGVTAVMFKPFSPRELVKRIQRQLAPTEVS